MSEAGRTALPRAARRRPARTLAAWVLAVALAPVAQATDRWRIHPAGLGPIAIGMPVGAVAGKTGVPVSPIGELERPDKLGHSCNYYSIDVPGQKIRIRVSDGLVDRVEVESRGFATASGIRVGDPVASVGTTYGRKATVEPHHYLWDRGFVHIVVGPFTIDREAYAVAFIGSEGTGVTEIWASRYRNIRESEGCQ